MFRSHRTIRLLWRRGYLSVRSNYTKCNWKVGGKFWAQLPHTKTRKKIYSSKSVRKHLICELWLKVYIYNECSKCPPWGSTHTSTRFIMDRHIRSKMPGQLRIVWQASTGRFASSLSTGSAYTTVYRFPSRKNPENSNVVGVEAIALGPLLPIHRSR
jgi:hypothetical protein